MKKIFTITLLVLLTVGLFVACNANAVETVFDTSYKVQPDGSWKMGNKVYEPSTKPYILVLPKTLNVEKDVQLEDLEAGMKTLEEIRSAATKTDIGNATVELISAEGINPEYYKYVNEKESDAQNIFMRTTDNDFTETILLNAPYDEFSHYGSLNVARVGEIAQNSYYEHGRVRKIILSIGHLVAKVQSQIDMIIVETNDTSKVSVDVETTNVKGIIAPEGVEITKPASVVSAKTEDAKFMDAEGKFYNTLAETNGSKITLLGDVTEALTIDKDVEIDMFGNKISGTITIAEGKVVTFTDSIGEGALCSTPTDLESFKIKNGNYGFDPTEYLVDKDNTTVKRIGDYYSVREKGEKSIIPYTGICFTAEEAGASVALTKVGTPNDIDLVYSTDGVNYQDYEIGTAITATDIGDKVYFKAVDCNSTFSSSSSDYYKFVLSGEMGCSGNIMYLLDADGVTTAVPEYAFVNLFSGCTSLTTVPDLPATTLAKECYCQMFEGCTGLTELPEGLLPATKLADYCYENMFDDCTGLTSIPEGLLPAMQLADYCYDEMFVNCSGLTSVPAGLLPATTLANGCYEYMFEDCTSLTDLPEGLLPATTLADYCYFCMFEGCTGLTELPEELLPATKLAEGCYLEMFKNCTLLTTAPALPATELIKRCYESMFKGCTSFTTVPELPATTLAEGCYYAMFRGCTSLTTVTTAPELPASTLVSNCYREMFYGCKDFDSVTMLATVISATDCLKDWLTGTAENGKLIVASSTVASNTDLKKPNKWDVEVKKYTVSFDLNGISGTAPENQMIEMNGKVSSPADPAVTGGYTLAGWYKTKDSTTGELSDKWDFSKDTVTANTTLYAQWAKKVGDIIGGSIGIGKDMVTAPENAWLTRTGKKRMFIVESTSSKYLYVYNPDATSSGKSYNFVNLNDNATLTASGNFKLIKENTYEITFNMKNGAVLSIDITLNNTTENTGFGGTFSTWSVIGKIESNGSNWDKDIVMKETSKGVFVSPALELKKSDRFKLRFAYSWDNANNYGAPGVQDPDKDLHYDITLGTPITATPGGLNMAVPADGNYIITLDLSTPDSPTIKVTAEVKK